MRKWHEVCSHDLREAANGMGEHPEPLKFNDLKLWRQGQKIMQQKTRDGKLVRSNWYALDDEIFAASQTTLYPTLL
jgi:hypothetical protein